jgi:hypothetical protein
MPRGLPIHQPKRDDRPLIFDLRPPKKPTEEIRKNFKFQLKASALLVILFYLVVGSIFTFVISKALRANSEDNLATVDFYVNTVRTLDADSVKGSASAEVTGDKLTDKSWSGIDKVLGEPEVSETGDKDSFSSGNSALYSGGRQSLICENFTTKEFIKTPNQAFIPETNMSAEEAVPNQIDNSGNKNLENKSTDTPASVEENPSAPILVSTSTENNIQSQPSVEQPVAPSSGETNDSVIPAVEENFSAPATEDSTAAQTETSPEIPANAGNQDNNSSPAAASPAVENPENSNANEAPAEAAPAAEIQNHLPDTENSASASTGDSPSAATDSGNPSEPVSLWHDLKSIASLSRNLFGQIARAQSLFGSDSDDRNILFGAFKSAKIKISLAAFSKAVNDSAASSSSAAETLAVSGNGENAVPEISSSTSSTEAEQASGEGTSSENKDNGAVQKLLDLITPKEAGAAGLADRIETPASAEKIKIIIWYSFSNEGDGNYWRELGTINADDLSNFPHNGYLTFDAPFLNDWRDLDSLRLKFEGQTDAGDDFAAYLDSVWAEITYQNGDQKKVEERKEKNSNKDVLEIDGKTVEFGYTDDNHDENLIIKTNKKDYFGLTGATVYFSVENTGVREEPINFQYYFSNNAGSVGKMERLVADSPYLTSVPKFDAQIYECANGWDKRGDTWTCYPKEEERKCDLVSPNRRYCRVEGVQVGTEEKIKYRQRWEEIGLSDQPIKQDKNIFQSLFGLGPQSKEIPENFYSTKATDESETIAPGEIKYFKAEIKFPFNSEGEFYIEAIGASDGYGLLDPWWNSGWNYRLPINLNNSGNAETLSEYQVYLEISSSTSKDFWRNVKADGSDIRFSNSSETVELPYWIQDFNYTASSAKIWLQVDSIPANAVSKIFLYYGNSSANTASNQYTPFTYTGLQNIFYVASSSAAGSLKVISLIDDNQVQLDDQTAINLNRQEVVTLTGFASTSVIKAKGPIMAKFSNTAAAESVIPVSFAGTSFVIPSSRNLENFHFFAPFANSEVNIYDGASLEQTHSISQNNSWSIANDIAAGSIAVVGATAPVVLSFANDAPGDSLIGYPATTRDLYGVKSQNNLIGAAALSSFSIFCSDNSSTTISALAAGALQENLTCSGDAQGQGSAVRIVGATGTLGAIQQDDGDGNESTVFLPFKEFSSEYILPTNAAHLAVVCAPETGTFVLSMYDSSDVFISSTTCSAVGEYPGKAYFGAADATTYSAGSRIVSANGQPFYAYYEDTSATGATGGDETNLFGAVQTRKYSYPDLDYFFGTQEIQGPPLGEIISATEKNDNSGQINIAIAVNDLSHDNCRAKIEYVEQTGGRCDFTSPLKPFLDESFVNASFGVVAIANKNIYQIGTSTASISTASGTNQILFNWNSKLDLSNANGTYCLRLTANDYISDQTTPATTTVTVDNVAPTAPGALTLNSKTGTSVTFNLGAASTDSHFKEYRIYYKQYDGTPITEAGTMFGSSTDVNLGVAGFNNAATTTITGLTAGLKYTFNIWAYDAYGNKASAIAGLDVMANDAPTAVFNSALEKINGSGVVDISMEVDDVNDSNTVRAKLEYEAGSLCAFTSPSKATIDTANITADFDTVRVDNNEAYQIGTTSYYILTSPGANTVSFDWLSSLDLPTATSTYCLRLTANDGLDDQIISDKIVVVLDNVKPIASGDLSKGSTTQSSIQLLLPINKIARDDNEPTANAYKIFYKPGTSGVKQIDSQFTSSVLNSYGFNGSKSVVVSGLNAGADYAFNIFSYDTFGNVASATEMTAKTDSDLTNKSLTFTNANGLGAITNIAVADSLSIWNFRAVVSDVSGYAAIDDVTLRLADEVDNSSPFNDLRFKWAQAGNAFSEIGADANSATTLSGSSASSCSGNSCTIDFQIIFAKTFATSSVNYAAELYSTDSSAHTAEDSYLNLFQIRKTWLDQNHYRWRNDDGGG